MPLSGMTSIISRSGLSFQAMIDNPAVHFRCPHWVHTLEVSLELAQIHATLSGYADLHCAEAPRAHEDVGLRLGDGEFIHHSLEGNEFLQVNCQLRPAGGAQPNTQFALLYPTVISLE